MAILTCFSLSVLLTLTDVSGEGNHNPLQYSCLENPMDRGAWWAAVHGVTKSGTRLKQLSSTPLANVRRSDSSWRRDKKLFSAVYVYKMYLLNLLPNYWFWLCPWWTSWKASYCSLNGWHGMVLLQTNVRKLLNKLLEHGFLLTLSLPRS